MEADLGEAGSGAGKEVSAQAGAGGGKEAKGEKSCRRQKDRSRRCPSLTVGNEEGVVQETTGEKRACTVAPRGRRGALHSAPWE